MAYFTSVKQGVHASGTTLGASADKHFKGKGPKRKSKGHSPMAAKSRKKMRLPK